MSCLSVSNPVFNHRFDASTSSADSSNVFNANHLSRSNRPNDWMGGNVTIRLEYVEPVHVQ